MDIDPQQIFDELERLKAPLSEAEGNLAGLEGSKSSEQSLGGQEREAYASKEYQDHNQKIAETTRIRSLLKLEFAIAQMKFEAWRSEQANNRSIEKNAR